MCVSYALMTTREKTTSAAREGGKASGRAGDFDARERCCPARSLSSAPASINDRNGDKIFFRLDHFASSISGSTRRTSDPSERLERVSRSIGDLLSVHFSEIIAQFKNEWRRGAKRCCGTVKGKSMLVESSLDSMDSKAVYIFVNLATRKRKSSLISEGRHGLAKGSPL